MVSQQPCNTEKVSISWTNIVVDVSDSSAERPLAYSVTELSLIKSWFGVVQTPKKEVGGEVQNQAKFSFGNRWLGQVRVDLGLSHQTSKLRHRCLLLAVSNNERNYSDLHIVLHNPIFVRAIWLCCDVTFWCLIPDTGPFLDQICQIATQPNSAHENWLCKTICKSL